MGRGGRKQGLSPVPIRPQGTRPELGDTMHNAVINSKQRARSAHLDVRGTSCCTMHTLRSVHAHQRRLTSFNLPCFISLSGLSVDDSLSAPCKVAKLQRKSPTMLLSTTAPVLPPLLLPPEQAATTPHWRTLEFVDVCVFCVCVCFVYVCVHSHVHHLFLLFYSHAQYMQVCK